jgi:hypothetical protein
VAGSREHCNEPGGSLKGGVFTDHLSAYQHLKNDSTPYSLSISQSINQPISQSVSQSVSGSSFDQVNFTLIFEVLQRVPCLPSLLKQATLLPDLSRLLDKNLLYTKCCYISYGHFCVCWATSQGNGISSWCCFVSILQRSAQWDFTEGKQVIPVDAIHISRHGMGRDHFGRTDGRTDGWIARHK